MNEKVLSACVAYCAKELTRKGFDGNAVVANRLRATTKLEELKHSDCVIEAATENLGLKRKIFQSLCAIVSDRCVLATNTSSIDLTRMELPSAVLPRFIGSHFFNPPSVMHLLEIIRTKDTSPSVIADWLLFSKVSFFFSFPFPFLSFPFLGRFFMFLYVPLSFSN